MDRVPADTKVPRRILAFDTAMSGCSVACACLDGDVFHEKVIPMPRGQAETLVPMIDEVLQDAGISYESLDAIATTVGPGAFTGLRIGLSTARALGVALGVDVLGFSTLDMIVYRFLRTRDSLPEEYTGKSPVLVVLETKRQDFYTQIFRENGEPLTEPLALDAAGIFSVMEDMDCPDKEIVVIGDAVERFQQESRKHTEKDFAYKLIHCNEYNLPYPADMIRMLEKGFKTLPAEPIYLRDADVSKPKKNYRTIDNLK